MADAALGLPSMADGLSCVPKMEQRECMGCAQQSIARPCQRGPRQTIPSHRRDSGQPKCEKRPARWQRRLRCRETHKGRKRHILVDTLGLLLGVHITPASTPDRCGAKELLGGVLQWFSWLRKLWVDGGYSGQPFADWVKEQRPKLKVEVVKRSDDMEGFEVLPRRWVVERTFGWLMQQRRLVRDYEKTEASAQAWVYITMIYLQTLKLA